MRTLNAKDKVLKRTKRLKAFIAYFEKCSLMGQAFTIKEARLRWPE